jgi:hypothetical protein
VVQQEAKGKSDAFANAALSNSLMPNHSSYSFQFLHLAGKVLRLYRSLYRLKQSPRVWCATLGDRVVRYLNKTERWKLRLGGKECELTAYADASFANDPDDFRST